MGEEYSHLLKCAFHASRIVYSSDLVHKTVFVCIMVMGAGLKQPFCGKKNCHVAFIDEISVIDIVHVQIVAHYYRPIASITAAPVLARPLPWAHSCLKVPI